MYVGKILYYIIILYYSLMYLVYCCQVWGSTHISIQYRDSQQERLYEYVVCSQSKYVHAEPLYKELKILYGKDIYNYLVGQFMFRYHDNQLPDVFDSCVIRNNTTDEYETRQLNLFRFPDYKINLGKRSIRYTGVKLWIEIMTSKIDVKYSQCVCLK